MTFYDGFFNSVDGDRTYEAADFNRYFQDLVVNGVLPVDGFLVSANPESIVGADPPSVIIAPGRAFYNGMFYINTANYTHPLGTGQQTQPNKRHFVYLCFDTNTNVRAVSIETYTTDIGTAPWGVNNYCPPAAGGKYYLPLAIVLDDLGTQPTVVEDTRIIGGVATQVADDAINNDKLQLLSVAGGNMQDGILEKRHFPTTGTTQIIPTANLEDLSVTLAKLAAFSAGTVHLTSEVDLQGNGAQHGIDINNFKVSIPAQTRPVKVLIFGTIATNDNGDWFTTSEDTHNHGDTPANDNDTHSHTIGKADDGSGAGVQIWRLYAHAKRNNAELLGTDGHEVVGGHVLPMDIWMNWPFTFSVDIPASGYETTIYFNGWTSGEYIKVGAGASHITYLVVPQ